MNPTPRAVPVSLICEKNFGKIVAAATVRIDIIGREDTPAGKSNLVKNIPEVTNVEATEIAVIIDGKDIEVDDPSSCIVACDVISNSLSSSFSCCCVDDDSS